MKYEIEFLCEEPSIERFNIYMTLAGYDPSGAQAGVESLVRRAEDGGAKGIPLSLSCEGCARVEAFLTVVADTMPSATKVMPGMDFGARLTARADGRELWRREVEINPWGGASLSGMALGVDS